ncbi:MAG TPA: hypothetical protein VMR25_02950 [Planctomycetaceae bacterium]|nr:hypothetical protein [Planctomycetaceae bacterium]
MKRQILFCLLIVSGNALLADEAPSSPPISGQPNLLTQTPVPIPAAVSDSPVMATADAQPGVAEPLTAPPTVVGPNGGPLTSQYPPPIVGQPGVPVQPGMGPPPMGFDGGCGGNCGAAPYGMQYGSPGGMAQPGLAGQTLPYSALTPDVTMVPTTTNGPLPDRSGWVQRYEFGVMPFSQVKDGWDRFGEWDFDLGWKYVAPLYPMPAIFSFEQQYDLRLLTGPTSPPGTPPTNLPGSLNRIGWDFELKTTTPGPWNVVVAFNPSIDSDFQKSLTHDAFNWDGRAAFLYTPSREVTFVLGAVFWDRLHEQILPWAGMIYRPNQYWQWDLTFPQARVSVYLWDEFGFKTSLYGRIEYHSEAYEIWNPVVGERDRVQLTDWRAMIGINKDRGDLAYFFEGGWIFGRHADYDVSPQGFTVDTGALIRAGVRF